jgi:hypothetical protein
MKKDIVEILEYLYSNGIDMNTKAILWLLRCFKPLEPLTITCKEYIADNLFSDNERKRFYENRSNHYFYEILNKRLNG